MLSKDDVHRVAREVAAELIGTCREEVDDELRKLQWTEERAKALAEEAADLAVKRITESFYMGVGRKTVATLGALVVAAIIFAKDVIRKWVGLGD